MARAEERVKAKEQALQEAEEQVRATGEALVRAEEQVKAKKQALQEAKEQVRKKKRVLEEAKGEVILRKLQKNFRALSARPHDYMEEKPQYVHFLDGGIADNIGLTPLLAVLDTFVNTKEKVNPPKHIAVIVRQCPCRPAE